jgi:hypothetical protein
VKTRIKGVRKRTNKLYEISLKIKKRVTHEIMAGIKPKKKEIKSEIITLVIFFVL